MPSDASDWCVYAPVGGRVHPSGGDQQGGRSAAVAEGEKADAGDPPEAEGADDGG